MCTAFPGERFLISSVTRDMDVETMRKIHQESTATQSSHSLQWTSTWHANSTGASTTTLAREDIVMDLTTAALGYGLDYAFTNMERARIGGLMGDMELAHPMSSGTTNAWAAREAWLKMCAEWEPRELRGPLWEVTTATNTVACRRRLIHDDASSSRKNTQRRHKLPDKRQKSRPIKIRRLGHSESLRRHD